MIKNIYHRLIIIVVAFVLSLYISLDYFFLTINISNVVKVDGVLNIWGAYTTLAISTFAAINTVTEIFDLPIPKIQGDRAALVIILIIAPFLTYITYSDIQSNIKGYVECKEVRKYSSRYSSRTYALSPELCESQ